MQIIIVSRHLKAARTITIMPRHLLAAVLASVILLFATSAFFSWLSVRWQLPVVEDLMSTLQLRENRKNRDYLENNLQLMATRLGELQARVLQLDALGERLSGVAGVKLDRVPARTGMGSGGPFLPESFSAADLQKEIERLTQLIERHGEDFEFLEFALLEQRVKSRALPTALPVSSGQLGSPFGYRQDPLVGVRAMHEGLDFSAETGTPVLAAADGVVQFTGYHPEFGNVIDIDHGEGLISRYAHLSKTDVKAGALIKRGRQIGAVGTTGRSTGSHLHFEVRMLGVAQNPALFLKQALLTAQAQRSAL